MFNYVKNSSSALDNVGFGSSINGIPSSTQMDPVDREYIFPMNYNDNWISNSKFAVTVPNFGYYGQSLERTNLVDGWGTLILPNGSYNVLRVKSILNRVDTTFIDFIGFGSSIARPEEIEYKWLAKGEGVPLLKIITTFGLITSIEYKGDVISSIDELDIIEEVKLFPNPAKHFLTIDFKTQDTGNLTLKLKDVIGKDVALIYNNKIDVRNEKLTIDLSQYMIESGIYLLDFLIDGKKYRTEKLVIN